MCILGVRVNKIHKLRNFTAAHRSAFVFKIRRSSWDNYFIDNISFSTVWLLLAYE